jgi:hypothetical protein
MICRVKRIIVNALGSSQRTRSAELRQKRLLISLCDVRSAKAGCVSLHGPSKRCDRKETLTLGALVWLSAGRALAWATERGAGTAGRLGFLRK